MMLLVVLASTSCRKEELVEAQVVKETSLGINTVPDSLLIKFISITQGVGKQEVIYDKVNNEFVVRGNKTDRVFLEAFYKDSNIYLKQHGE